MACAQVVSSATLIDSANFPGQREAVSVASLTGLSGCQEAWFRVMAAGMLGWLMLRVDMPYARVRET